MWSLVFDALLIVTMTLLILGPAVRSLLEPGAAAIALVALVALMGVARRIRGGLVRLVLRLALPAAALAYFVLMNGEAGAVSLLGEVAVLFMLLFGVYVMFRGSLPRL